MTAASFYILLALDSSERHGYEILKHVDVMSDGRVRLGPGTLYTNLKRMQEAGLIVEVHGPRSADDDPRRRYYKLSRIGRAELSSEVHRMKHAIAVAERTHAGALS